MKILFYIIFLFVFLFLKETGRYRLFIAFLTITIIPFSWELYIKGIYPLSIFLIVLISIYIGRAMRLISSNLSLYIPFLFFAIYSLIPTIIHNEIHSWFNYCLQPLLILLTIHLLSNSSEKMYDLLNLCLTIIIIYFIVYQISGWLGTLSGVAAYEVITKFDYSQPLTLWAPGDRLLEYGFFRFIVGHNQIAALLGLGILISFVKSLHSEKKLIQIIMVLLVIIGLLLVFYTTSRSVLAGILVAMVFLITIVIKINIKRMIVMGLLFLACVFFIVQYFIGFLNVQQLSRYIQLLNISGTVNFAYRIGFFYLSLIHSLSNIWGLGFNYYYFRLFDDAMLYSFLINGL
jgi:hypothetical protein